MKAYTTIVKYGLSVRQIPEVVFSTWDFKLHKEGNEIIEVVLDTVKYPYEFLKKLHGGKDNFIFDEENQTVKRLYTRESKIPKNAGWWMCKQVNNTSSNVAWNMSKDNLAPTLEKSIELFLNSTAQ